MEEVDVKNNLYSGEDNINFSRYLQLIIYHKWIAIPGILTGIVIGLLLYFKQPEIYVAEFSVYLRLPANEIIKNEYLPKESDPRKAYWLNLMSSKKTFSLMQQISGIDISAAELQSMFHITSKTDENIFNIKLTVTDPALVPTLAINFVKALNLLEKENINKKIQANIDYLNNQISAKKLQLDSINNYIVSFAGKLNIDNISSVEQFKNIYENFLQQLKETEVELNYVTTSRIQTEKELNAINDTIFEESSFTEPLKVQLMNLHVDLARALTKYGNEHPVTIGIKNNIRQIEKMLNEGFEQIVAVKNIKANPVKNALIGQLIELKIKEISLQSKIASLKNILKEYNYSLKQVIPGKNPIQLLDNLNAIKGNVELLENKLIDLELTKRWISDSFFIIEVPGAPSHPNTKPLYYFILLGLIFGIFIGIGIVVIYDYLDDRIKIIDDFHSFFDIDNLGIIQHRKTGDIFKYIKKLSIEEFHEDFGNELADIRISLNQRIDLEKNKKLTILSPLRKEGKTSLILMLALQFSLVKKKVLLIDMDINIPKLTPYFGYEKEEGFMNIILDCVDAGSLIKTTEHKYISILPAGFNSHNTKIIFDSHIFEEFMTTIGEGFDIVLIDIPAFLLFPYAMEIIKHLDACILVTRLGGSHRKNIELLLKKTEPYKNKIKGNVFIDVHPLPANSYYHTYKYKYYYSGENKKRKNKLIKILTPILLGVTALIISAYFIFSTGTKTAGLNYNKTTNDTTQIIPSSNVFLTSQVSDSTAQILFSPLNTSSIVDSSAIDTNKISKSSQILNPKTNNEKITPLKVKENISPILNHPQKKYYYIIAGSFKEKENAEKYLKTLIESGYTNILNLSKIKGFYTIAVYSTPLKDSALIKLEILKKELKPDLWIYYHK
jgi:Mrp family chromosome partitioning ATPase/uncharacterized protein involved in exopolysaccharide biosynthesis